jgi:hypothetical protein
MLIGMQTRATTTESSMEINKSLEIELPYDPLILLWGIYPKVHKRGYNRDTCIAMYIAALFAIAELWSNPVALQLKKDQIIVVHIHSGVLLSHEE